jgi:transcriptional regulator with XRE-family HTH domain
MRAELQMNWDFGLDAQDPRLVLARRLRALREDHFPGKKVTQQQLARALGGVSVPLISSWESQTSPRTPPLARLEAYSALFATARAFDAVPNGEVIAASLTDEERAAMSELRRELMQLRSAAMRASAADPDPEVTEVSLSKGPWYLPEGKIVTIVCARLPQRMIDRIPYGDEEDPDHIELLTYSELDSLFELHGHLRAANPAKDVYIRQSRRLASDDLTSHVAMLGGVDWNELTKTTLERLELPVRQVADWSTDDGQFFEVDDGGVVKQFRPNLEQAGGKTILHEDIALFVGAVSPFNRERRVTICSGMYGRGTLGVVRAFTDANFRDRNAEYVASRFGDCECYCILSRVPVIHGRTLTPDWSTGEHILFEWSR